MPRIHKKSTRTPLKLPKSIIGIVSVGSRYKESWLDSLLRWLILDCKKYNPESINIINDDIIVNFGNEDFLMPISQVNSLLLKTTNDKGRQIKAYKRT